jgi:hypothetical protein
MYAGGAGTQKELGALFGVNDRLVSRLVRGKIWKHQDAVMLHRISAKVHEQRERG